MSKTDECLVCGNELVFVESDWMTYWRHVHTSSLMALHRPIAKKEYEEAEQRSRERYCYSEHPKFTMVFCRKKPNHEGKHRSYGGFEWKQMVSLETKGV